MGHNLCLDIFGGPSDEEAAAGVTAHGEASVARYQIEGSAETLTMSATLPLAQIVVRRRIDLEGRRVRVRESVENLAGIDRPIGWTQHVTLGPPYLEQGTTEFHLPATRSKVFDGTFGPADYLKAGAEFEWPLAPLKNGGTRNLQTEQLAPRSRAPTPRICSIRRSIRRGSRRSLRRRSSSSVTCGAAQIFRGSASGKRTTAARTRRGTGGRCTRAVEFGVSPFPESRREMVARGRLFGEPTFRWLPAKQTIEVEYRAVLHPAESAQPLTTLA